MTVSSFIQSISADEHSFHPHYAIFGLDSINTLKGIIDSQFVTGQPLTIKVFDRLEERVEAFVTSTEFKALFGTTSGSQIIAVAGCQRVKLNHGTLILDFYFGDYLQQLRQWPACQHDGIRAWLCSAACDLTSMHSALFWLMAQHSHDDARCFISEALPFDAQQALHTLNLQVGLTTVNPTMMTRPVVLDDVQRAERLALRAQQHARQAPFPVHASQDDTDIAVIGGGIASASLVLSLAERHRKIRVFCEDDDLAQAASGNKQGAIYPLLTPDHNHLSQYFQQAYLFSLHRLTSLAHHHGSIAFDLCGVLHTGHDDRSRQRIQKIINGHKWHRDLAYAVDEKQSSKLAGVDIEEPGIFYPLGGWVSPHDLSKAAFDQARQLSEVNVQLNTQITALEHSELGWFLITAQQRLGPYKTVVVANGRSLTRFEQTKHLPITGFRGQVSHAPSRNNLTKLSTVLCAHGYMTPAHNALHCLGASYIKNATNLNYNPQEQVDNLLKIQRSYVDKAWSRDIDITQHSARVGVRMVTRDHAPMMGPAPDFEAIMHRYQQHQLTPQSRRYWQNTPAPVHKGLYILGGFGSRGLSSGLLAAEALAAQICAETMPLSPAFIALLNPNRMWLRKLLKGKSLEGA